MFLYSIHDVKTGVYNPPIAAQNHPDIMRRLSHGLQNNPKDMMATYPTDFQLVCLGKFDDNSGFIDVNERPGFVCNLSDLIVKDS